MATVYDVINEILDLVRRIATVSMPTLKTPEISLIPVFKECEKFQFTKTYLARYEFKQHRFSDRSEFLGRL